MCAIALLENVNGAVKVSRRVDFHPGHEEMDRAYGWDALESRLQVTIESRPAPPFTERKDMLDWLKTNAAKARET